MKAPRSSLRLFVVGVVSALLIVACAPAAPAPTPAPPAAPPKPAPTSAPAAAPKPAPTAAQPAAPKPAAPAATAAPKPAGAPAAAAPAGKLTVAVPTFLVEDVVPYLVSGATMIYTGYLYDFLVGVDENGRVSADTGVATAWESSEGGRVWTFRLRTGVKFHDGSDLTAEDVAFSIGLLASKDAKASNAGVFQRGLDKVTATSPTQVVVQMKEPQVELPATLSAASGDGAIMPKAYFEKVGLDGFRQKPVGSGPWKFVSRKVGSEIQFEANTAYWRGSPAFKELVLRLVPEASTRQAMIRTGEADIVDLPKAAVKTIEGQGLRVVTVPYVQTIGVQLYRSDDTSMIFNKKDVREALNLAIDRQAVLDKIFVGKGDVAASFLFTAPMPGFDPTLKPYRYDPERARQLIKQANLPASVKLKLWAFDLPGLAEARPLAQAIAGFWNEVGVQTELVPIDFGAFRGKYTGTPQQFSAPGEASVFTSLTFPSSLGTVRIYLVSAGKGGIVRLGGPDTEQLDGLYQRASAELNPQARVALLQQINQSVYNDYLLVPLVHIGSEYAVGPKVGSWTPVPGFPSNLALHLAKPK